MIFPLLQTILHISRDIRSVQFFLENLLIRGDPAQSALLKHVLVTTSPSSSDIKRSNRDILVGTPKSPKRTHTDLRAGRICRDSSSRLAPRRNASPPPYAPPAESPREPDLDLSRTNPLPQLLRPTATLPAVQFMKEVTSTAPPAVAPSPTSSTSHTPLGSDAGQAAPSPLHPRVAVILGVDRRWYIPLLVCRAMSTVPSAWWGLRCAFTFLAELLHIRPGMGREGWAAAIVGSVGQEWDVERRFRVTEVALAIMWVSKEVARDVIFQP